MNRWSMWVGAVLLAMGQPSVAAPVTFYFGGVVSESSFYPAFQGQTFAGNLTFDSATPDSDPAATVGRYITAGPFSVSLGGFTYSNASGTKETRVSVNHYPSPGSDSFEIRGLLSDGPTIDGFEGFAWGIRILDAGSGLGFMGTDLPLAPPPLALASADRYGLEMILAKRNSPTSLTLTFWYGWITYLSGDPPISIPGIPVVPVPTSFWLMLSGLALLGLLIRRRVRANPAVYQEQMGREFPGGSI